MDKSRDSCTGVRLMKEAGFVQTEGTEPREKTCFCSRAMHQRRTCNWGINLHRVLKKYLKENGDTKMISPKGKRKGGRTQEPTRWVEFTVRGEKLCAVRMGGAETLGWTYLLVRTGIKSFQDWYTELPTFLLRIFVTSLASNGPNPFRCLLTSPRSLYFVLRPCWATAAYRAFVSIIAAHSFWDGSYTVPLIINEIMKIVILCHTDFLQGNIGTADCRTGTKVFTSASIIGSNEL